VNGVPVFANPAASLADTGWTNQSIDISALADNNASVQVEVRARIRRRESARRLAARQLRTALARRARLPDAGQLLRPVAEQRESSRRGDGLVGDDARSNNDFVLRTSGCPANKTAVYLYSQGDTFVPFGNGIRCVAAPIHRLPLTSTDSAGNAAFALDLNHLPNNGQIHVGEDWYFQLAFRDPAAGGFLFNDSDSLRVSFCP